MGGAVRCASELCKRGYEVAFTMGNNTPLADLMLIAPESKRMLLIDVKGLRSKTQWMIREKVERADLYYVLCYVGDPNVNRYWVLGQSEVGRLLTEYRASGIKYDPRHPSGFNWTTPREFEGRRDLLPR